ncbi:hypothetical protein MKJ01_15210 [Chryseobacterium sp. SSA4.19]|uniref:hypothetical protein n=1 Tax=Chryseobacterium sp. SSA4.19 TaxID=2919915 RepID=UPI001F4E6347|nr:hypothetical protein [Chryseobacterium sp. SSA4.19]MCJ8155116.1 hypothetical protein [Chryseobacterium sp. SSA4.19]
MSIKIQVAMCTKCNGYSSAAPLEKKDSNHPEIIDHFFYHGEPWFTLEQETFEKSKRYAQTEIVVMDLEQHVENDHLYCHCNKKAIKENHIPAVSKRQKTDLVIEKYEVETEIYFKDLYYTYNNFHGIHPAGNYNSNRKYG